jgi:hypothetical protein
LPLALAGLAIPLPGSLAIQGVPVLAVRPLTHQPAATLHLLRNARRAIPLIRRPIRAMPHPVNRMTLLARRSLQTPLTLPISLARLADTLLYRSIRPQHHTILGMPLRAMHPLGVVMKSVANLVIRIIAVRSPRKVLKSSQCIVAGQG